MNDNNIQVTIVYTSQEERGFRGISVAILDKQLDPEYSLTVLAEALPKTEKLRVAIERAVITWNDLSYRYNYRVLQDYGLV